MTIKTTTGLPNMDKMPGWFSWRHKTREAHEAAREQYIATHATAQARLDRRERRGRGDGRH